MVMMIVINLKYFNIKSEFKYIIAALFHAFTEYWLNFL